MKRAYTRAQIVEIVKGYDTRARKLTEAKLDEVLDNAYAELSTIVQAFSNEEIIDITPYRDAKEFKFTLDILEDVSSIYDLYVTIENPASGFLHGIQEIRDENILWKDSRYDGRVHADISKAANYGTTLTNIVIKYYFVPVASTETVFLDAQTMLAFKYAIGVALYDELADVVRSEQKRAGMKRTALAIMPSIPEDAVDPDLGHVFTGLKV